MGKCQFRWIWKFKALKLYDDNKFLIIGDNGVIFYLLMQWNGNSWKAVMGDLVTFSLRWMPATVEVLNYDKLILTQEGKKTLLEYDINKNTKKRTEIKE